MAPGGAKISYALKFGFRASNNTAEYEAIIAGMELAAAMKAKNLKICSDSQLVVNQINGNYQAKDATMQLYLQKVKELLKSFNWIGIEQIPRLDNLEADILAKLASGMENGNPERVPIEWLHRPTIERQSGVNNIEIEETTDWRTPLIKYLKEGKLPDEQNECKALKIIKLLQGFLVQKKKYFDGHLYKFWFISGLNV